MAFIHLVSLAYPHLAHLEEISRAIFLETGRPVRPMMGSLDIAYAYDTIRQQHHSSRVLLGLLKLVPAGDQILGVTAFDLFIPILTFVFGEAQLDGPTAVVSSYRLNPELYGLPHDEKLMTQRLIKEAIHEIGHTFGLRHCRNFECVMHASTYAEEIDLKQGGYCPECRKTVNARTGEADRHLPPV
jgi:archaemetzincin